MHLDVILTGQNYILPILYKQENIEQRSHFIITVQLGLHTVHCYRVAMLHFSINSWLQVLTDDDQVPLMFKQSKMCNKSFITK
jgi:hypothetical protein